MEGNEFMGLKIEDGESDFAWITTLGIAPYYPPTSHHVWVSHSHSYDTEHAPHRSLPSSFSSMASLLIPKSLQLDHIQKFVPRSDSVGQNILDLSL